MITYLYTVSVCLILITCALAYDLRRALRRVDEAKERESYWRDRLDEEEEEREQEYLAVQSIFVPEQQKVYQEWRDRCTLDCVCEANDWLACEVASRHASFLASEMEALRARVAAGLGR